MVPAEGLFALRAHPFGVALKGDRRRCAASSNPTFLMSGVRPISVFGAKSQWTNFFEKMPAEGFEPPTYGLQNRCTTTVLSRRGAGPIIANLACRHRTALTCGRAPGCPQQKMIEGNDTGTCDCEPEEQREIF